MSINVVSPLRRRMIEDMTGRQLGPHSQRSHISSCKRFAAFLKRSPDTRITDRITVTVHSIARVSVLSASGSWCLN